MPDILLVLSHLFTWKFLCILTALVALGLALPERHTRIFRSVKFNIYLFTVIAIASSVGTFLPTEQAATEIYHAWWFCGLLALMAFDVVACKLRGIPGQPAKAERWLMSSKMRSEFVVSLAPAEAYTRVKVFFSSKKS